MKKNTCVYTFILISTLVLFLLISVFASFGAAHSVTHLCVDDGCRICSAVRSVADLLTSDALCTGALSAVSLTLVLFSAVGTSRYILGNSSPVSRKVKLLN